MKGTEGPAHRERHRRFVVQPCIVLLALAGGCARYEFDLVEPAESAGHVGSRAFLAVPRDSILYRVISADDRLVMFVHNRGEGVVKLSGADSAAVDARGESHPLQGATIPPGAYVNRIFPPPRPTLQRTGWIGGGIYAGHGFHHHHGFSHHGSDDFVRPRYNDIYDAIDPIYFDWPGGTELRLLLTFEQEGAGRLRHEFVFRKRKM